MPIDYRMLSEEDQLRLASGDDLEARFVLAGAERLPLSVQLVLVTDPDEAVRGSILTIRNLEPAAVRLAEQREQNSQLRADLSRQTNASVALKRLAPLHELFEDAVVVALNELNLPDEQAQAALREWKRRRLLENGETFGEMLDGL